MTHPSGPCARGDGRDGRSRRAATLCPTGEGARGSKLAGGLADDEPVVLAGNYPDQGVEGDGVAGEPRLYGPAECEAHASPWTRAGGSSCVRAGSTRQPSRGRRWALLGLGVASLAVPLAHAPTIRRGCVRSPVDPGVSNVRWKWGSWPPLPPPVLTSSRRRRLSPAIDHAAGVAGAGVAGGRGPCPCRCRPSRCRRTGWPPI